MYGFIEKTSDLKEENAIYNEVVEAGKGWMHELLSGQSLRIVDMEGNQAVDTTFYDMTNPEDHYGAIPTIVMQKNIYLTTGTILRTESGKPLLEITADLTGRHDTIGGACSAQSNTVRYAREKIYMHNCRDSFMLQLADDTHGFMKRDLAPNINFFMNVPVSKDGGSKFDDGVSAPKCSTCQKAKKWLDEHEITYTDRHIVEQNPSYEELKEWHEKSGLPLKKFFNTSGLLYKEMKLKDRLPEMSGDEQLKLLATNGMLVKRPLIVDGSTVITGFKEKEWSEHFL